MIIYRERKIERERKREREREKERRAAHLDNPLFHTHRERQTDRGEQKKQQQCICK
jgi:hypothetical protein